MIRKQLIEELNTEVEANFGGNKTEAASAASAERSFFTKVCNGTEEIAIDRLVEMGANLGWQFELKVKKKTNRKETLKSD